MSTNPNIIQMKSLYQAYIDAGFALCVINEGKGPKTPGWNAPEAAIRSASDIPEGAGVGLLHAYSTPVTCALDIDNLDDARMMLADYQIDLYSLLNAPNAVQIISGNAGHSKLLYRLPAMRGPMPSKQVKVVGKVAYELRCATAGGLSVQDVLPSAVNHPMTGRPYVWGGAGDWRGIPTLPDSLLAVWDAMIARDGARVISTGAPLQASWAEVQAALECIPPDIGREDWLHAGMALHYAATQMGQPDEGLRLWDSWSSGGTKYKGQRDILYCWNSFKVDKDSTIRLGTLFKLARDNGWVRPMPDVSEMFRPIVSAGEPAPQEGESSSLQDVLPPLIDPHHAEAVVPLDLSIVPPVLATRAAEIGRTVGCDPAVPLWAGLAAASAAMDYRSTLTVCDGFEVHPILWLMTIGKPADKKTPGSAPMISPLGKIETEDLPRQSREMRIWEAKEAIAIAAKKRYHAEKSTPEALLDAAAGVQFDDVPPEMTLPPKPHALQITVQDITSQRLARTCAEQPRGVMCHLDEMSSWMRKMADPKSGESRSTWVQAHEGGAYKVDRVADGAIHVDNLSVGIYGNVQPRVFKEHAKQLMSDGLLQRFLYVKLDTSKTKVGDPVPAWMTTGAQWEQLLRLLSAMPAGQYKLSEAAYKVFRAYQDHMDTVRQREDLLQSSDVYQEALGKQVGQCARMALVWHAIESPWNNEVSEDLMIRVVRFMKGMVIPTLRAVLESSLEESTFDAWLRDLILTRADQDTIAMPEIKRQGHGKLSVAARWEVESIILDAMHDFERVRWVARMDDGSRTSTPTWAINPQLKEQFSAQRDAVITARQARRQEIYSYAYEFNVHPETLIGKDVHGYDPAKHGRPMGTPP